jgi:hypothetical protein
MRQYTFVAPPGSAVSGAREPVRRLVDGAVAAEHDDDVVALGGRLPAELARVAALAGVDRVDLVAALEGVYDEALEARGNGGRVGVRDHEHPLALHRRLEGEARACAFDRVQRRHRSGFYYTGEGPSARRRPGGGRAGDAARALVATAGGGDGRCVRRAGSALVSL